MLADTLLAAAVLALAAAVILGSFSASLRASRSSENITRATLLLEGVARDVRENGSVPSSGSFTGEAQDFKWEAKPAGACSSGMCPADVRVIWTHRGKQASVGIVTYVKQERKRLAVK